MYRLWYIGKIVDYRSQGWWYEPTDPYSVFLKKSISTMFSQFLKKQSWSTVWSGSQALQSKLSCADRGVASPNVTPLAGCTVYSSRINWLSINYFYIVSNKLMHNMVTLYLCISKFRYLNENEFLRHTSVLISEVYHPDTGGHISGSICNSVDIRLRVPNTLLFVAT